MATDPERVRCAIDGVSDRLETCADATGAIGGVRRAATAYLADAGVTNIPNVILVLSELVTNAVLHAGGAGRVAVECIDDSVRITVHDSSPLVPRSPADAPAIGGKGLHIVERLSSSWGSRRCEAGKDVWAVLPARPGPG